MTDAEMLAQVDAAFAGCPKPEHFTNHTHCSECARHDEFLQQTREDIVAARFIANGDPWCFCGLEGWAYHFPALARLALRKPRDDEDPFNGNLLFHLQPDRRGRDLLNHFSPSQRQAVRRLLQHLQSTRPELVEDGFTRQDLERAIPLWS